VGTRCADHVTPLYPQKLALTSPTGGSRSVGIVRVRTKATEYVAQYVTLKLPVFVIQFSIFSSICCGSVIWRYVLVLNLCGRLGERPLLWGAGSEIWHWLHQVFLVTLLVIWLIQRYENCPAEHWHRSETLCDGWRQHSVTVKDSSIVRDVTPCTLVSFYQFIRCHIKYDAFFILFTFRSSTFNLW